MSRLATRIARLEQLLPPCRACSSRRTEIELLTPERPAWKPLDQLCRDCGEPVGRLAIRLAFDPDLPSGEEQP